MKISNLSGNEIYCLAQKGYAPGNIVVGNSVYSLGALRGLMSGFKSMIGGELPHVTQLIHEGRTAAYQRMLTEAENFDADGITGISSELIYHMGNIEFLSMGAVIHAKKKTDSYFSTSGTGQALYAQIDAGFKPLSFAFGNVAYSLGVGRSILSRFKQLGRGEIKELSGVFNQTRHLALQRIIAHAKENDANAVIGIETKIINTAGLTEMLMIGTASHHENLTALSKTGMVTSGLSNIELWSLANLGYAPMQLVIGTSVYSLGLIGGITSALKSFIKGEITELTTLIYDARENALGQLKDQAQAMGADEIVGVKTYVYQLSNGLIEFMAIGTAVKKVDTIQTQSKDLPVQVIATEQDMYFDSTVTGASNVELNQTNASTPAVAANGNPMIRRNSLLKLILFAVAIGLVVYQFLVNGLGH